MVCIISIKKACKNLLLEVDDLFEDSSFLFSSCTVPSIKSRRYSKFATILKCLASRAIETFPFGIKRDPFSFRIL